MSSRILPAPDDASRRTIRRSRVLSYCLVAVAAVVLSLRPEVFGDPQAQPAHALLHVWRVVLGVVLIVAAAAVQFVVGVRWRAGLRRDADGEDVDAADTGTAPRHPAGTTDSTGREAPGNRTPGDR